MGLFSGLFKLLVYSLAIVGFITVAFVILAYGWDGEPPQVGLERESDQ